MLGMLKILYCMKYKSFFFFFGNQKADYRHLWTYSLIDFNSLNIDIMYIFKDILNLLIFTLPGKIFFNWEGGSQNLVILQTVHNGF